jgi:predicted DNA-binding transcriptional regulator AlpA
MKLNTTFEGREFTRAALARFFKRSVRTIDRWGIARTDLITAKEAAARIGVSDRTFTNLCHAADFPKPALRIGQQVPMWRCDELDRWKAQDDAGSQPQQLSFL